MKESKGKMMVEMWYKPLAGHDWVLAGERDQLQRAFKFKATFLKSVSSASNMAQGVAKMQMPSLATPVQRRCSARLAPSLRPIAKQVGQNPH